MANEGVITQVIGSTFDAQFPDDRLPDIYNAVTIEAKIRDRNLRLTGEVQKHLGGGRVVSHRLAQVLADAVLELLLQLVVDLVQRPLDQLEVVEVHGPDLLVGGQGNDFLVGLAGNDNLLGGTGADDMQGGTGNDVYYADQAGDTIDNAADDVGNRADSVGNAIENAVR